MTTQPRPRRLRGALAAGFTFAAVLSSAAVLTSAGPAAADTTQSFQNEATGGCLDGGPGFVTEAGAATCGEEQPWAEHWSVHNWADGTVELQELNSAWRTDGYCLDDSIAYGLRYFPCNASQWQSWFVLRYSDGSIAFKNQSTLLCLDDHKDYYGDDILQAIGCNNLPYQRWT